MGRYDSSLTRVQPVFDALLDRSDSSWATQLWTLAQPRNWGNIKEPLEVPGYYLRRSVGAHVLSARRPLPPIRA